MASGDSIGYTKRVSTEEVFPDNPNYKWSKAYATKTTQEKANKWFKDLRKRWNEFEHDPKSSIYRYYGHDYDSKSARTIKMPSGDMSSGNTNRMVEQLPEALLYRLKNFDKVDKNGWRVFEKIIGKYDVEATDEDTLKDRLRTLVRFTEIIREDEYLTRYDPLTNKEAITQVGAEGEMNPIEYTFPLGLENTDFLHYVVYEPEVIKVELEDEGQIESIVRYELLNYINERQQPLMPKRAIGLVMSKHSDILRPHIGHIQGLLQDIVPEYNTLLEEDGAEALSKLLATMDTPNTKNEVNEDKLVEVYKKIAVGPLLNKIKSKTLLKRLNRLKPPSNGKAGGVSWPVSAGGDYMLWITQDPFELLTKSTGRKWSERNASCENWDGCYAEGPVSDVKYGNCIVWVYKKGVEEYRHEIGRFLLRWGDAYSGGTVIGHDIGVEAQVYPKDPRESPWGFNLLGAIGKIIKDAGLLKYEVCKTPYKFMGYSDKAGAGKCRINYDSKIFLKGQGVVEVDNANALVSMASDEALSYADSGYVLNYGNAQALLALAQNPVVWIYENTIRRLFTRAMDLEEGSQIIRFLIDSSVANFDWIIGTLDTMEIFDENYNSLINSNIAFLTFLLRSPLCTDEAHRAILASHPGYEVGSSNSLPIWAIGYLNILQGELTSNPILTTAPADILDSITDEVVKKHFMADFAKQPVPNLPHMTISERVLLGANIQGRMGDPKNTAREQRGVKLIHKYLVKLIAMKQLIYQPKLSLKSYGKLLTDFNKIWNKRLDDEGAFDKVLDIMKKHFAITLCLPLQNHDDWGYMDSFGGITLSMGNTDSGFRDISTILDGDEIKYPIYTRQSAGTVRRMMDIYPELVIPAGDEREVAISALFPWQGLLLRNIRDTGAFKELVRNTEIPRWALLDRLTNPQNASESIVNPFLNARTYGVIYRGVANHAELIWDYRPSNGVADRNIRTAMPEIIINSLLSNPEVVTSMNLPVFAGWLRTPEQFNRFISILFDYALGPYATEDLTDFELDPSVIDFGVHYDNIENIEAISYAAIGGNFPISLSSNPYLPSELQMQLLIEWPEISEKLGGDYDYHFNKLVMNLSLNPAISGDTIAWLLENYPITRNNILQNSKITMGDELVKQVLKEDPAIILKNYNLNIKSYINTYKSWMDTLKSQQSGDAKRFAKTFGFTKEGFGNTRIEGLLSSNNYEIYQTLMDKVIEMKGINFWRGGNFKKKMNLPPSRNVAPFNIDKDRPMALVDEPIPIMYEHLIWQGSATKNEDGQIEMGELDDCSIRYIKTISEDEGLIRVTGFTYTWDEIDGEATPEILNTTYNSYADMYHFIPLDRRGDDEGHKWGDDLVLVLFDTINPNLVKSLPNWRMNITESRVMKTLTDIINNPKVTTPMILELIDSVGESFNYTTEDDAYSMNPYTIFKVIDFGNKWTPEIINAYLIKLFNTGEAYANYENLLPINSLFDITLSEDEGEVKKILTRSVAELKQLQLWILKESFEDIIPIQYVYACITMPHIHATVKQRAKQIRQKRLAEYLTLMTRDEDIQVNDAEESHSYEWKIFNSEINNILITYCEIMYPNNIKLQEKLMNSITSGETHLDIEEMGNVIQGRR